MSNYPKDIDGLCNAYLYLGDDYGDNETTCRCRLAKGHDGYHEERFVRDGKAVIITWELDEREYSKTDEAMP